MDNVDGVSQRWQAILVDNFVAQLWKFDLSSADKYSETCLHPVFSLVTKGQYYHLPHKR